LRHPSLLLLDEATSALDNENEQRIQLALDELHGELSIVVIAHRLSTIRHADQIVVIDNGRVVENGSWEELVARQDGRLRALLKAKTID
jgi:ATP-binding cassette subfamily C protein